MSRSSTLTLYRAYPKFKVPDDVVREAEEAYAALSERYRLVRTDDADLPEVVALWHPGVQAGGEEAKAKTVEEYRLRNYTGYFLRDRRIWCDRLLSWDFSSGFDALIDHYMLEPYTWSRSSVLLPEEEAQDMLFAIEYLLGGVWDDRIAAVANNGFVRIFSDGYNCTSYWKYMNRRAIDASREVYEFEKEGCKVTVQLPDRKEAEKKAYTPEDAEGDMEIERWLRDFASGLRAFLESDGRSNDDDHELVLEYSC